MRGHGPAVAVDLVHGLRAEEADLVEAGVGVLAHQVMMPDLTLPAMVVLVQDAHSVTADQSRGHDRQALLGDEEGDEGSMARGEVAVVAALDWTRAQRAAELLARAAEVVDKHEGSPHTPTFDIAPIPAYLPATMEETQVSVTVLPVYAGGSRRALVVGLVVGRPGSAQAWGFGAPAARKLSQIMSRYAARVRRAPRSMSAA